MFVSTAGIRDAAATGLGARKLASRFIGPFTAGRLKKYHPIEIPDDGMSPSSTVTFQRDGLLPLVDASGAGSLSESLITTYSSAVVLALHKLNCHTLQNKEGHYRVR
ncbi:uncharacterized protein PHALS_07006 [Plasmopara halstedii]|uniref:Uncharacterized protein n=1 Tax=Plasmopara halstedii TaxID=4781 RepID=A0A0P1B4E3_PLAHL|nr:uncharacterized protein PHALS_07006 [Plasmopara halstedii]CEG49234.1 hypothetical protein PHALS_07006 [Plasmopara halstedii]|eukprot:XP_024585603.1 hypothetical protein PHALS_07006 [Plasmopara halstedii]